MSDRPDNRIESAYTDAAEEEGRMTTVRLTQDYVRDIEFWVAYPADPRWTYHDKGEVLDVGDEEARQMIKEGVAVLEDERGRKGA
jgi:hypothetical protein